MTDEQEIKYLQLLTAIKNGEKVDGRKLSKLIEWGLIEKKDWTDEWDLTEAGKVSEFEQHIISAKSLKIVEKGIREAKAGKIVKGPNIFVSNEQFEKILDLIENPKEPTEALKNLMKKDK